jgi:hypothetical protein
MAHFVLNRVATAHLQNSHSRASFEFNGPQGDKANPRSEVLFICGVQRDRGDQARFLRRPGLGTAMGLIFKEPVASTRLVFMLRSSAVNASILPFAKRAASAKVLKV